MKVKDVSKLLSMTRETTESVIGNSPLWADFKKDYPQLSAILDGDNIDQFIMDMALSVTASYINGWMRGQGKLRGCE